MDYTPTINQLMEKLWYLFPIFVAIAILKNSWFKGVMGEFQINILLKLFLPKDIYHLVVQKQRLNMRIT